MKVIIHGEELTSDNFKYVIDSLNEEYKDLGIKVKDAICYIRFSDKNGKTIDNIVNNKCEIEKVFRFEKIMNLK